MAQTLLSAASTLMSTRFCHRGTSPGCGQVPWRKRLPGGKLFPGQAKRVEMSLDAADRSVGATRYCWTFTISVLLVSPFTTVSGMALPVGASAGSCTSMRHSPTAPGTSPL